jgi:hypothetical protein
MNVQTFSFDHFNLSVTRPGSGIDLQNALLVSFGSSHSLNDLKQVTKMGTSGLTESALLWKRYVKTTSPSRETFP